jgi:spermidine/putrescine transport system ATP-binding protein
MFIMDGELRSVVYWGATTLYVIGLARGVEVAALVPNSSPVRREDRPELGQLVTFGWYPEHCLVIVDEPRRGGIRDPLPQELASYS